MHKTPIADTLRCIIAFTLFAAACACVANTWGAEPPADPKALQILDTLPVLSKPTMPFLMRTELEVAEKNAQNWKLAEAHDTEYRASADGKIDVITRYYKYVGLSKNPAYSNRSLWNGNQFLRRQQSLTPRATENQVWAGASIRTDRINHSTTNIFNGAFLRGILLGDDRPVTDVLRHATSLRLKNTTETVGSANCLVLEAVAPEGAYTLWIDPAAGHSIRKALIRKKSGDICDGKPIPAPPSEPGKKASIGVDVLLDDVQLQPLDGHFLPVAATLYQTIHFSDGSQEVFRFAAKSQYEINPDFKKLGAFVMDGIPEGTLVDHDDFPGLHYVWHNGAPVLDPETDAIKRIDQAIDNSRVTPAKPAPASPPTTTASSADLPLPAPDPDPSPASAAFPTWQLLTAVLAILALIAILLLAYRRSFAQPNQQH
ncbi:MAG: hypothetical protein NTU53_03255 [Planctomycetota bacterium]|nr:hypothetical protein [Planctomycetota bacterium]